MKKSICSLVILAAALLSINSFADETHQLSCGISAPTETPKDQVTTHYPLPGYEVGGVKIDGAAYTFEAAYLSGELDLKLTAKATGLTVRSESYGGIPAGKMAKVMFQLSDQSTVIGYCQLK